MLKYGIGMAVALGLGLHAASLRAEEGTAAQAPGFRTLTVAAPARGQAIGVTVWYPAKEGGEPAAFGASPVFTGVTGRRGAAVADGRFPVVLIAHGGLRANPGAAGWIAAALARRGTVAVIAHPPALKPTDARRAVAEAWLRPGDLSVALDAVLADPELAPHAAPDRVAALGFFLGGTSALAVAGGRLDGERFRGSCDAPRRGPDCGWFTAQGVDLHAAAGPEVAASRRDPRVTLAVAVDPELADSFAPASLSPPAVPVHLLHTGPAVKALKSLIPGVEPEALPAATPFSLFGTCTPKAAAILEEEGEDPALCRDGDGPPRAALHTRIAERIGTLLDRGRR